MKLLMSTLGILFASLAIGAEENYAGINLGEANAVQMNLCSLKPGKSMSNYDRVQSGYVEWSKENGVEVFVLRLTPVFSSPPPNANATFDFIDMQVGPFGITGDGWTKWLATEDGQKLNAQWQDTADCRVSMNAGVFLALNQEALSARDDRMMTFDWCTANDGVNPGQLAARHRQMASNWTAESPIRAWTVMYPMMGSRNTPGDYAHLMSFDDASGLMTWQNGMANNEGWRARADYESAYASCTGTNVYHARVVHRPGS